MQYQHNAHAPTHIETIYTINSHNLNKRQHLLVTNVEHMRGFTTITFLWVA